MNYKLLLLLFPMLYFSPSYADDDEKRAAVRAEADSLFQANNISEAKELLEGNWDLLSDGGQYEAYCYSSYGTFLIYENPNNKESLNYIRHAVEIADNTIADIEKTFNDTLFVNGEKEACRPTIGFLLIYPYCIYSSIAYRQNCADAEQSLSRAKWMLEKYGYNTTLTKIYTDICNYLYEFRVKKNLISVFLYKIQNENNKADEAYSEVMKNAERLEDTLPIKRIAYKVVADYYFSLGDFAQAEKLYITVKELYEMNKDLGEDYVNCLISLSCVLIYNGITSNKNMYKASIKLYLDTAVDVLQKEKVGEFSEEIIKIAYLYAFAGYGEEGLSRIDFHKYGESEVYNTVDSKINNEIGFGLGYIMMNNMEEARNHLEIAYMMSKKSGNRKKKMAEIEHLLVKTGYGEYEKLARKFSEDAYINTMSNFVFLTDEQRTDYVGLFDDFIYYNTVLAAKPSKKNNITILQNALFSKGLLLRTSNWIRDRIHSSANDDDMAKLRKMEEINKVLDTGNLSADSMACYQDSLIILEKELNRRNITYAEFHNYLMDDWKKISNNLDGDDAAIEFIELIDHNDTTMRYLKRYAAVIVTHGCKYPKIVDLCGESELESIIKNRGMEDKAFINTLYASILDKKEKLYTLIWEPMEASLENVHTIYYSPVGKLSAIAFDAVKHDERTLHDIYDLRLVSSIREINNLKSEDKCRPQSAVVYGGIAYDALESDLLAQSYKYSPSHVRTVKLANDSTTRSGWSELDGSMNEAEGVMQRLDDNNIPSKLLSGVYANEESFKDFDKHSPWLIHIATHGFYLSESPKVSMNVFLQRASLNNEQFANNVMNRSGLLFAGANRAWLGENVIDSIDDGILTAEEISCIDLSQTKIAVLSACESGLGESKSSEGIFGLQRAFKLAGVNTLIMSLWKVDDKETSALMLTFYDNWLSGMSKRDAFRKAQDDVRSRHKYEPYYWAAFVMLD